MREAIVQLDGLTTGYALKQGHKIVAKDITASLYSGELTCLLGPNGAGKSTLLRTLSAILPPVSGRIYLRGRSISDYSSREMSTLLGLVLTEKCSIRNMTVRELVGLGRSPYTGFWGNLSKEDEAVIERSLEQVGISFLRKRMIHTLSDGERQKVMIAKTLAQETPVIFLDEPTAFLDFPSKVEVMQLLRRLSREMGKTVFLSTHDLELALQIADKIWLLDGEKQVRIGTPEDLSLDGSLSTFFSGKEIQFDMERGLFRIETACSMAIGLVGAGTRCSMLKKALQRNGIATHTKDDTEYIEVLADGFVHHSLSGEQVYFSSIEDVLTFVCK